MTEEQIKLLRLAIQREVEYASIDGMEHGAWGWAEKDADAIWKSFQESFNPVETDGFKNENAEVGFEDGIEYGETLFARSLLEQIGVEFEYPCMREEE